MADAQRAAGPTSASAVTAITPSSYNLGVSLGWRRFAISGDVAQADAGLIAGTRESAQVGMSYRATRRLTGSVAVAAERAEGGQRILAEDQAYSLDVGGAFTIARNIDVTAGARYRIARDRLEPLAATTAATARRSMSAPPSASEQLMRPRRRFPPSRKRRTRRACARARRVHAAERDDRQLGAAGEPGEARQAERPARRDGARRR